MDGWPSHRQRMGEPVNEWVETMRSVDGWMDGDNGIGDWMDGWTDGWMDVGMIFRRTDG